MSADVVVWAAAVFFVLFILMLIGEVLWVNMLLRKEQRITARALKGWEKESKLLEQATFQWDFPEAPEISHNGP